MGVSDPEDPSLAMHSEGLGRLPAGVDVLSGRRSGPTGPGTASWHCRATLRQRPRFALTAAALQIDYV